MATDELTDASATHRLQAILRAWLAFKEAIGGTSVRNEDDYARARATIELLLDEIGDVDAILK